MNVNLKSLLPSLLLMGIGAGCAAAQMKVDRAFASHSSQLEIFSPKGPWAESRLHFGPYEIHNIQRGQPQTKQENSVQQLYSFWMIDDRDREWLTQCEKVTFTQAEQITQLTCSIFPLKFDGDRWTLHLSASQSGQKLAVGEIKGPRQWMQVLPRTSQDRADTSVLGFDITSNSSTSLATVQTADATKVWLHNTLIGTARSVVAASAIGLILLANS